MKKEDRIICAAETSLTLKLILLIRIIKTANRMYYQSDNVSWNK